MKEIQTFVSICECGTFAHAAEQLNLTQSAVSAQIKNLEKQLGFALFNRNRRGAVLSEAGERALPIARKMIELFHEMMQSHHANAHSGGLKIGVQHSLQAQIAPALLPRLSQTTQIKLLDSIKLLDDIRQQQQHIVIVVRPDGGLPHDWVVNALFYDECVLLAPHNSGSDYATLLATRPVLAYDTAAFGNHALALFFKQHGVTAPILTSHDAATLVNLVAQNMGVTVLPKSCLKNLTLHNLVVLPVPLAREIVVVSLVDFAMENQAIGVIWQHNSTYHKPTVMAASPQWQHTHETKETFGLPKMTLTKWFCH